VSWGKPRIAHAHCAIGNATSTLQNALSQEGIANVDASAGAKVAYTSTLSKHQNSMTAHTTVACIQLHA
jgi:hypothetical protein